MNPSTRTTCFPTGQLSVFISVDSQLAVRCHRKSTACSVMPETAAPVYKEDMDMMLWYRKMLFVLSYLYNPNCL